MVDEASPSKRHGMIPKALLLVALAVYVLALLRGPVETCAACAGSCQFPKAVKCKLCEGTGHPGSFSTRRTIDRVLDLLWNWW